MKAGHDQPHLQLPPEPGLVRASAAAPRLDPALTEKAPAGENGGARGVSTVTVSGTFWSSYLTVLVDLFGRSACIAPTTHRRLH